MKSVFVTILLFKRHYERRFWLIGKVSLSLSWFWLPRLDLLYFLPVHSYSAAVDAERSSYRVVIIYYSYRYCLVISSSVVIYPWKYISHVPLIVFLFDLLC